MRIVAHARNLTAAANTFHTTRWTLGRNGAGRATEARYSLGELFVICFP